MTVDVYVSVPGWRPSIARIALGTIGGLALLLGAVIVVLRQPTLGHTTRLVAASADPGFLRRHVMTLSVDFSPRDGDHVANLLRTADYIGSEFAHSTTRVARQRFAVRQEPFENVVADFGPRTGRPLIVGAHYDSFGDFGSNPGADDNASGVAGLLELARLLAHTQLPRPVELVAYSTEEPPYFGSSSMGSAVHARSLARARRRPVAMICLEMIGYFSPRQRWPHWLLALGYGRRGDFIAIAGRWQDRGVLRSFKRSFRGASNLPVYSVVAPAEALDASDQRNYWSHAWPAVLLTDTAFVRNPHYHASSDSADSLDYRRMALVVDGLANVVAHTDTLGP